MARLDLRVGASIDRNMAVAFQPLIEGAKRAKAAIEAEGKKAGAGISTGVKKGAKDAEAAFAALEAEMRGVPKAMNAGSAAVVKFGKDAKSSFDQTRKAFADLAKDAEKNMAKFQASSKGPAPLKAGAAMRDLAKRGGGALWNAAGGTESIGSGLKLAGSMGLGLAKQAIGAAAGIAKDLANAAGVDTDMGSIAKKNFQLQTSAQNIANAGYMPGESLKSGNAIRVRKEEIMSQALDVGTKTGTDANKLIEGLDKFTGKTGDLKTGRDIMEQMSMYAKATGGSVEDYMDAAGDVANQLGDVENKGKAVSDLMRSFAGQGKLGAVEIKNLATQMAKIGAASVRFEGDKAGSITQMGVLAQMARARGGAFSASNAATSVGAFSNVFSKGARLNAFEALGVDVQGKGNKVKSPKQLIVESLQAAEKHAGLGKNFDKTMGTMFSDVSSRKSVAGFEAIYKENGGGKKGVEAVTAEFERLENAIISDEEVMESFQRAMKTGESQAEVFNNQIRKSALQMQTDLMPALASLAAAIVPAVSELAKWVQFMTGDKTTSTIAGQATEDVDAAGKSTAKQLKGGKISDVQIEANRIAANEAREARDRAKAELAAAKETLETKQKNNDYSFWTNPLFANKADDANSLAGRTLGANEAGDKKNVEEKEAALKKTQDVLDKATAMNAEVKRKLDGKLVVVIDNVEAFKAAAQPPGNGPEGRQPGPGEKPR